MEKVYKREKGMVIGNHMKRVGRNYLFNLMIDKMKSTLIKITTHSNGYQLFYTF